MLLALKLATTLLSFTISASSLFSSSLVTLSSNIEILAHPTVYRPILIWHGMGDSCCNPQSIGKISSFIEDKLPGVVIRSVRIGDTEEEDRRSSFFGNMNQQIEDMCRLVLNDAELTRNGFNAIGFSQGGQFLRALTQRCPPPAHLVSLVYTLVTFGSQHMGIADGKRQQRSSQF